MTIAIEKGIPIPGVGPHRTGVTATLRAMAVGDSFLINENKRASVYPQAKKAGVTVRALKVAPGQVRVWRTE